MSIESTLVGLGAQCVGGDLILQHKVVGHYRLGEFSASLEGIALVEDVQKAKQDEILAIAREFHTDLEVDVSGLDVEVPVQRRGRRKASE